MQSSTKSLKGSKEGNRETTKISMVTLKQLERPQRIWEKLFAKQPHHGHCTNLEFKCGEPPVYKKKKAFWRHIKQMEKDIWSDKFELFGLGTKCYIWQHHVLLHLWCLGCFFVVLWAISEWTWRNVFPAIGSIDESNTLSWRCCMQICKMFCSSPNIVFINGVVRIILYIGLKYPLNFVSVLYWSHLANSRYIVH